MLLCCLFVPDFIGVSLTFFSSVALSQNLHVFQSLHARAELEHLMSVPTQLISPRTSKPCMSVVQDGVIGSYLLTDKDTFLDRAQFFDLSMHVKYSTRPLPKPAIFYKDAQGRRACAIPDGQKMRDTRHSHWIFIH